MGLDLIEFTAAIEDAFGIYIPNPDADAILTPRQLVDYLLARAPSGSAPACLEQRAFYRIRAAGVRVLDKPRIAFAPDTPWADLLHSARQSRQWELIGAAVGLKPWPRLQRPLLWGSSSQTVGGTAREVAMTSAGALLAEGEGWSRARIEELVRRHMAEELRVTEFNWDDRFIQDLGCG